MDNRAREREMEERDRTIDSRTDRDRWTDRKTETERMKATSSFRQKSNYHSGMRKQTIKKNRLADTLHISSQVAVHKTKGK